MVNFMCKDCGHVTKVSNKDAEGYLNYKCEKCQHIANKEGVEPNAVIWKTTLHTAARAKYKS